MAADLAAAVSRRRAAVAAIDTDRPVPAGTYTASVSASGVPAEWVWRGGATSNRAVLYLHGGAFVTGSPAHSRLSTALIALSCGVRHLSLDYRLAPEHPFPAALDDVLSAYGWLLDRGVRPEAIAFAGTSAGGNLALAAALGVGQRDLPRPAAIYVVCPVTDLAGIAGDESLTDAYLAGRDPAEPLISPARGALASLPPIHVEVGTADPLAADNRSFVEAARAAGVIVDLHETPGSAHSFIYQAPESPEATAAIARIGGFVRWRLGGD